jgi:hypothetical protein
MLVGWFNYSTAGKPAADSKPPGGGDRTKGIK